MSVKLSEEEIKGQKDCCEQDIFICFILSCFSLHFFISHLGAEATGSVINAGFVFVFSSLFTVLRLYHRATLN